MYRGSKRLILPTWSDQQLFVAAYEATVLCGMEIWSRYVRQRKNSTTSLKGHRKSGSHEKQPKLLFTVNKVVGPLLRCKVLSSDKKSTVFSQEIYSFRGVWFHLINFSLCPIQYLTHAWSIKYRLFTKRNAQIETVLRDEFFKPRS